MCLTQKRYKTKPQFFSGNFPFHFIWYESFLYNKIGGGNNAYLCFSALQLENISKVQGQTYSILPQRVFTKVVVALNTC